VMEILLCSSWLSLAPPPPPPPPGAVAVWGGGGGGGGWGPRKGPREPLAPCAFAVEKAHERPRGDEFRCTNRRFADFPDTAPGAVRAFDLREGLSAA